MYKRAHKNNAFDLAISATRPSLRRALPILADPGQQEAVIIAAWVSRAGPLRVSCGISATGTDGLLESTVYAH